MYHHHYLTLCIFFLLSCFFLHHGTGNFFLLTPAKFIEVEHEALYIVLSGQTLKKLTVDWKFASSVLWDLRRKAELSNPRNVCNSSLVLVGIPFDRR